MCCNNQGASSHPSDIKELQHISGIIKLDNWNRTNNFMVLNCSVVQQNMPHLRENETFIKSTTPTVLPSKFVVNANMVMENSIKRNEKEKQLFEPTQIWISDYHQEDEEGHSYKEDDGICLQELFSGFSDVSTINLVTNQKVLRILFKFIVCARLPTIHFSFIYFQYLTYSLLLVLISCGVYQMVISILKMAILSICGLTYVLIVHFVKDGFMFDQQDFVLQQVR